MSTLQSLKAAVLAAIDHGAAQRRAELSARCYRLIAIDRAQRRRPH